MDNEIIARHVMDTHLIHSLVLTYVASDDVVDNVLPGPMVTRTRIVWLLRHALCIVAE
jgi:hypothetical protein